MKDQAAVASTPPAKSHPPISEASKKLLPWLVAIAFFMDSLDSTILNTAVPSIARSLQVSPLSLKGVLASYTLSLAIFIPISGWMADRFGTRRVFSAAIALFTLSSLLCGLSTNLYMLIGFRVLQGAAGAMMVPVGKLALVNTFDKLELVRVLSFVTIPGWLGPILGPVVGGAIITHFDWNAIFFVNLPIGVLGLIVVYRHLPDYFDPEPKPFDLSGFLLFGSGIAFLSYGLEIFGEIRMSPGEVTGLLAISMVLISGYALHATRVAFPLFKLSLFRIPTFSAAVWGSFLTRIGVGGMPFLLPLLYQVGLGFSPMKSGLLILPQAVGGITAKLALPRILGGLGFRSLLIGNTVILSVLLVLFSTVSHGTPIWLIVFQASCYGACTSLQYTTMNTMAYADIDGANRSSAGAIASTAQELSISFGIASAGLVTGLFMSDAFSPGNHGMMNGLNFAFVALAAMTLFSLVAFSRVKSVSSTDPRQHKDCVQARLVK